MRRVGVTCNPNGGIALVRPSYGLPRFYFYNSRIKAVVDYDNVNSFYGRRAIVCCRICTWILSGGGVGKTGINKSSNKDVQKDPRPKGSFGRAYFREFHT